MDYNQAVRDHFFQKFYIQRIDNHYSVSKERKGVIDIAITMFWHGIVDFYGKLHLAGVKNKGFRELRVEEAYEHFISEFFPDRWSCKSSLLYEVFRCGMIHQISPKYAGIEYIESPYDDLLYPIQDPNNPNNPVIPLLNCRVYGDLVYSGFKEFERRVDSNIEPTVYENIYNKIISVTDGLKDQHYLNTETRALGNNPYGPCI